jgi:hypothetical protein
LLREVMSGDAEAGEEAVDHQARDEPLEALQESGEKDGRDQDKDDGLEGRPRQHSEERNDGVVTPLLDWRNAEQVDRKRDAPQEREAEAEVEQAGELLSQVGRVQLPPRVAMAATRVFIRGTMADDIRRRRAGAPDLRRA